MIRESLSVFDIEIPTGAIVFAVSTPRFAKEEAKVGFEGPSMEAKFALIPSENKQERKKRNKEIGLCINCE